MIGKIKITSTGYDPAKGRDHYDNHDHTLEPNVMTPPTPPEPKPGEHDYVREIRWRASHVKEGQCFVEVTPYTLGLYADELTRLQARVTLLESAIRAHRDQKGDDRCWLDDATLYEVLGEEVARSTLPPKCEFLESCTRYWEQRRNPRSKIDSSGMTIAQLESLLDQKDEAFRQIQRAGRNNIEGDIARMALEFKPDI